jgi:catechol 2,3-dioxygenase-like lactoylglutathione lyase family enzyme
MPAAASSPGVRPARLHHHARVVRDQEATRAFYEDVLGLPLVATWCEEEDFGEGPITYCHTFYQLGDGSALAFFQFADPAIGDRFRRAPSPFEHVALHVTAEMQDAVAKRAREAGVTTRVVDHGYCRSLYLVDPDGGFVELTVDAAAAVADRASHHAQARDELARWLAGDRHSNNVYRRG